MDSVIKYAAVYKTAVEEEFSFEEVKEEEPEGLDEESSKVISALEHFSPRQLALHSSHESPLVRAAVIPYLTLEGVFSVKR